MSFEQSMHDEIDELKEQLAEARAKVAELDKERLARLAEESKSWPAYKRGELGVNAPSRIDSNSATSLYRQVSQLRECIAELERQLAEAQAKVAELEQRERVLVRASSLPDVEQLAEVHLRNEKRLAACITNIDAKLVAALRVTSRVSQALQNGDVRLYLETDGDVVKYCVDYRDNGTHSLTETGDSLHEAISAMTIDEERE